MSKGSKKRPCLIPRWLEELNWDLALGKITREEYDRKIKERENG